MESRRARRGDRRKDRLAREFVPKRHRRAVPRQRPGRQAGLERRIPRAGDGGEQQCIEARSEDGGEVEHLPRGRVEARGARQDRVAQRLRQSRSGGENLGDEERVAGGPLVEIGRVEPAVRGEYSYRRGRQRQERQSTARRRAREIAEHTPQRVTRPDLVVAIGGEHQAARSIETPTEIAQQIERRVVGPVHVFEDQHHGRGSERVAQRGEYPLPRRLGLQQAGASPAERRRDVHQRTQRSR